MRVGLCLERSLDLVAAVLGVLKAGGVYVPLDPHSPDERLRYTLEDSGARAVLTSRVLAPRFVGTGATVVILEDLADVSGAPLRPPVVRPEHVAYVIYTSGSTGRPKGVVVSHRQRGRGCSTRPRPGSASAPDDVWTLFHSYAFDFSVWEIWGALLYGGRLVVVPYEVSRSPEAFHELLCARAGDGAQPDAVGVPAARARGRGAAGQSGCALRYVVFGGEALELQALRAVVRAARRRAAAAGQHVRHHRDHRARHVPAAHPGRRGAAARAA